MPYKIINPKKRLATMLADAVGHALFWPRRFRRVPPIQPEAVRRILVIRTAYIGDVVMTLPILKPLKDRFPGARITVLTSTSAAPVLENNPYVDEILIYDAFWFYPSPRSAYREFRKRLRSMEFDLVIEARGDIRDILFLVNPVKATWKVSSGIGGGTWMLTNVVPGDGRKHRVEYHLDMARFLGCPVGPVEWGIRLTDGETGRVDALLKESGLTGRFLAVHPGSRLPLKRWAEDKCAELYDRVQADLGLPVAILSGEAEVSLVNRIVGRMEHKPVVLAGKLGVRELAGVLARASAFVCNDSAPMHIAACMGTPTVALFGPSKSAETGPYGSRHRVVESAYACRWTCDENTCRHDIPNGCMKTIGVDEVLEAVRSVLAT